MSVQKKCRLLKPAVHQVAAFSAPFLLSISLLWGHPSSATTIIPMGLDQVVEQSDLIFEGKVIALQIEAIGVDLKTTTAKSEAAPKRPADADKTDDVDSPTKTLYPEAETPVGLGVEGGRMLFTHVTMTVDRDIGGGMSASTVTFKVAGGTEGDNEVTVSGMPKFELDKRYVVFLRNDYSRTAAPIVGVNQGFFKVVSDPAGADQLLTDGGDIVVAIEGNELVVRQNPANARGSDQQPEPAPVPSAGSDVQAQASPQVARYFNSNEPPMAIADFARTVGAIKEGQK